MQDKEGHPTKFRLFSDYFSLKYSDYLFDENKRVFVPKPETPVTNFNQLRDLLLSKDLSRMQELEWIDEGVYRFLDGTVPM